MPYVSAAPNIERQGVIAGFVLGIPPAGLTPSITRGVLFLGGVMYRPVAAPALPAAAAGQQSWLYYGAGGFYWRAVPSPAASGDAFIGWVVTSAAAVVAVSAQRVLVAEEPAGTRVIGLGPVKPIEPPPPGGDAPAAPNVTAATVAVVEETIAGEAWFHFGGVITLPTGDPNYAALRWIHIVAIGPDPLTDERPMGTIYVPEVAGGSASWRSDAWRWPEGGGFWDFEFRCENTAGVVTAGPYRVEDVELVGRAAAPLNPDTISAHEHVSERKPDINSLVYTPIDVEYTMPAGHGADYLMVWVTAYDGVGWDLAGKWWLTETIRFWRIVPAAGANWKVRVLAARWDAENGTPLESAAFAVAPISDAKTNGITAASLGTVGYGTSATGTGTGKWWGIDHVRYTLPTQVADPNFWHSELTVCKCDAGGNAAPDYEGAERVVIAHDGFGRVLDFPILWWTIPAPGSAYKYFRFKLYSVSRNETRVLQTTCWGGAAYAQVVVEQPTPGSLDLSTIDPAAIGQGLVVDGGKLKAVSGSNDNIVLNPNFEDPLGAEWQYHVGSAGVTRLTSGGRSGNCCLRMADHNHGVYQSPISANAGDVFAFQAWFWKEAGTNREVYLTLLAYNGDGALLGNQDVTVSQGIADATWTASALGSYTCPAGTAYVMLRINPAGEMSAGAWRADCVTMRLRVGSEILADSAVITSKLANLAVDNSKLANLAVDAAKLANSAVEATKIANLAVGAAAIAYGAIGSAHIGNGVIQNAHILDATIQSAKIASLAAEKISAGTISVAITLTSPTIQVSGGTFTINIDTTYGIKVTSGSKTLNLKDAYVQVAGTYGVRGYTGYLDADSVFAGSTSAERFRVSMNSSTGVSMTMYNEQAQLMVEIHTNGVSYFRGGLATTFVGVTGTFTSADGKTVTVTKGLVTSIA